MRHFFVSFLPAVIVMFILNGCASSVQGPMARTIDTMDSTSGTLLYSISTVKPEFSNYYLGIFHLDSRKKEKLYRVSTYSPDIKNDSVSVHYNAITLPAGEYKIYAWGLEYPMVNGTRTFFPKGNFSIMFTVSANRINYIGDYLAIPVVGRDLLGIKQPTGGYFVVSNRFEKDYQTITSHFSKLDFKGVIDAMPDFSANNTRYSLMYLKGINIP